MLEKEQLGLQRSAEQYDVAADLASMEFKDIAKQIGCEVQSIPLTAVANWWKRWYVDAGHKRLGRVLLKHAQ